MKQSIGEKKTVEQPLSGCKRISDAQVKAIVAEGLLPDNPSDFERFYYCGFLSGLQFVAMEEDSGDMYGKTAREFADNGYEIVFDKTLKLRLKRAAEQIFKEMGVEASVAGVGTFREEDLDDGR